MSHRTHFSLQAIILVFFCIERVLVPREFIRTWETLPTVAPTIIQLSDISVNDFVLNSVPLSSYSENCTSRALSWSSPHFNSSEKMC